MCRVAAMGSALKRDKPCTHQGSMSAKKQNHFGRHVIPYLPRIADTMIKQHKPHYAFAESKTSRNKRRRTRDAESSSDFEDDSKDRRR